ncbi:hypothetical protein OEA41_007903 [Lepraria neglecta]|uniref:NAD(P)-binding protein n=1 Tax=Lepraria neglecta TaxID=209136 RepID=A0AAE0DQR3_9LECA|nr:hypothetical protein OEA41_007903 [Lepraria neglecta]
MAVPYSKTMDGLESQFGTIHIGHFLFTNLIMPKLLAAERGARVINVSSSGHKREQVRFDDYNNGATYHKWKAYGQSKTANMFFSVSLAEKLGNKGLLSFSVYPGRVKTNIAQSIRFEELRAAGWVDEHGGIIEDPKLGWRTISEGAATTIAGAFDPSLVVQHLIQRTRGRYTRPATELWLDPQSSQYPRPSRKILFHLLELDLLLLQRVNKTFQTFIENSPCLPAKLFLTAVIREDEAPVSNLRWNRMLDPLIKASELVKPTENYIQLDVQALKRADYPSASWKKMFLTQPAVGTQSLHIFHPNPEMTISPRHLIRGLRMGQLVGLPRFDKTKLDEGRLIGTHGKRGAEIWRAGTGIWAVAVVFVCCLLWRCRHGRILRYHIFGVLRRALDADLLVMAWMQVLWIKTD